MFKYSMVLTTFLVILISCSTSPMGRRQLTIMPSNEVDNMGMQAFENLKQETPIERNLQLNQYVNCIATATIQASNSTIKNWEVVVFQDDSANAFALPGGKVGVHTGILPIADNQDRLAAVLGHEVGHVVAEHGNERISQQFALETSLNLVQALANVQTETGRTIMGLLGVGAQVGFLLPYSRLQESEADLIGLDIMARAGFDPRESVSLWQNMSRAGGGQSIEFLSTHPSHETRIHDLNKSLPRAMQLYSQAQAMGLQPRCRL